LFIERRLNKFIHNSYKSVDGSETKYSGLIEGQQGWRNDTNMQSTNYNTTSYNRKTFQSSFNITKQSFNNKKLFSSLNIKGLGKKGITKDNNIYTKENDNVGNSMNPEMALNLLRVNKTVMENKNKHLAEEKMKVEMLLQMKEYGFNKGKNNTLVHKNLETKTLVNNSDLENYKTKTIRNSLITSSSLNSNNKKKPSLHNIKVITVPIPEQVNKINDHPNININQAVHESNSKEKLSFKWSGLRIRIRSSKAEKEKETELEKYKDKDIDKIKHKELNNLKNLDVLSKSVINCDNSLNQNTYNTNIINITTKQNNIPCNKQDKNLISSDENKFVPSDAVSKLRMSNQNFRARSLYLGSTTLKEIDNKKLQYEPDNLSLFDDNNMNLSKNKLFKPNSKSLEMKAKLNFLNNNNNNNNNIVEQEYNNNEDLFLRKQNFINHIKKNELNKIKVAALRTGFHIKSSQLNQLLPPLELKSYPRTYVPIEKGMSRIDKHVTGKK